MSKYDKLSVDDLIKLHYNIVTVDHHKDRDCHWCSEKVWSYGEPPTYHVVHYGYVGGEVHKECETAEAALKALRAALIDAITDLER